MVSLNLTHPKLIENQTIKLLKVYCMPVNYFDTFSNLESVKTAWKVVLVAWTASNLNFNQTCALARPHESFSRPLKER